jgi:hypothetical protein
MMFLTIDSQLKTNPPSDKMALIASEEWHISGTVTPRIEIVLNISRIIFLDTDTQ